MPQNQPSNSKTEKTKSNPNTQDLYNLALVIILGSFVMMGVVVIFLYLSSGNATANQTMQTVLTSVLPLLGAWVGAVIAFYFSSKNLDNATKNVQSLVSKLTGAEKLKTIPVQSVMIPKSTIYYAQGDDDTKLVLSEMIDGLEKTGKGDRIPVLGNKDNPRYVIHRSIIDKFVSSKAVGGVKTAADPSKGVNVTDLSKNLGSLTLNDLIIDQPNLKYSFGIVNVEATLADAKSAMNTLGKQCQDVFVTQKGTYIEPIIGWITNAKIEEYASVGEQSKT